MGRAGSPLGWSFACPDWAKKLRAGRSLIPKLPLDQRLAKQAVGIFNMLRLPDVPGTPTLAEAAGDWYREIVAALFGSIVDGVRMVREPFLLVPKKNSKTTNAAATMLTALLMNQRPRAEFLLVGPTQAIADLSYSQSIGMIDADDAVQKEIDGNEGFLKRRFHIQEHIKTITDRKTKAKLRIRSFDPKVLTGPKPSGVLIDELHEIAKISKAANIIGQLRGGMISQPEAFMMFITTQSDDPPTGAFASELVQARKIRDGLLTGVPMLPVLYEFPEEIAQPVRQGQTPKWHDSSLWPMVTPNLGRSITLDRLKSDFAAAQEKGEAEVRRWASQHLNIEIGLALRSDRWAGADYWEACAERVLGLDDIIERSEVIVVGIDGGGLDDLLGVAVVGRDRVSKKWLIWAHAWAYKEVLKRRQDIAAKLQDFANDRDLTIVEDLGQDIDELVDIVEKVHAAGLLPEENAIGLDPVGIGQIVDEMTARGIAPEGSKRIVGISQGWKLSGAIKTTERKLAEGMLVHSGSRMMAWVLGNAKVEPRGNAISITKQASGSAKIDALMALFDAVALMSMNPEAAPSVYEERGLLIL